MCGVWWDRVYGTNSDHQDELDQLGQVSRHFVLLSWKSILFDHHARSWSSTLSSKVPEGHHPRGTTLREALRGICLSEDSAGVS